MPGIIKSATISDGRSFKAISRPFNPSSAEMTLKCDRSEVCTSRMMSGVSSTTSATCGRRCSSMSRSETRRSVASAMSSSRYSSRAAICTAKSISPRSLARDPAGTSRDGPRRSSTSSRKWSRSLISSTVNRAPPADSARMFPPCSSTISFASARPIPVPPYRRVPPMSTW